MSFLKRILSSLGIIKDLEKTNSTVQVLMANGCYDIRSVYQQGYQAYIFGPDNTFDTKFFLKSNGLFNILPMHQGDPVSWVHHEEPINITDTK